jgi:hypothetical protein
MCPIERLLDHLETAVNGWTIDISPEASDKGFKLVNIFEGLGPPPHPPYTTSQNASDFAILLRNGPVNPSFVERWLKLHAYYEKLTSIAYAGAIVMNPYRKLPF